MGYASYWSFVFGLLPLFYAYGSAVDWLERPQSVSVVKGGTATFRCRLSIEDPDIYWIRTNSESTLILFVKNETYSVETPSRYSIENKYDLVISNVIEEDNGNYVCSYKDAGTQSAQLTVLLPPGPPTISLSEEKNVYTEGQSVVFTCQSTGGNPAPVIMWLKNGEVWTDVVTSNPAQSIGETSSSSITVAMDRTDHQANYSCLVYNDANMDNKLLASKVLNVEYSPSVTFRPYFPEFIVRLGQTATIECVVDANPPVNLVSWEKDGISLTGRTMTRTFSPVTKQHQGNYTCSATNGIGGTLSGTLRVNVHYSPILNTPSDSTVDEGSRLAIDCTMDANPLPYEVQWSKTSSQGTSKTIVNSEQLVIPSVSREDAGNYSCRAHSQLRISGESKETVSSESFTIVYVRYKPGGAVISEVPDVDVGERLQITCTASPTGYPEATYLWRKDSVTRQDDGRILVIASASLSDNGQFSCTPRNAMGSGTTASVNVNVYEPPTIDRQPPSEMVVSLNDDNPLFLTCAARGYPAPRVSWFRQGDGRALNTNGDYFTVNITTTRIDGYSSRVSSRLLFQGSKRNVSSSGGRTALLISDMGEYSCQAESDKHTDTPIANSILLINFTPVMGDTPIRYAVSRLESASLRCTAQAHPDPTFQWYYKGQELLAGSRHGIKVTQSKLRGEPAQFQSILLVESVSDDSYGVYTCAAVNEFGNVTKTISLTGKSPPEKPVSVTVQSKSWGFVTLAWVPGFYGGYEQHFFIHHAEMGQDPQRTQVRPSTARSFNVTKLRPRTTYTFQVVAANELGFGPQSEPVVVTTNDLQLPVLSEVPMFDAKHKKLVVMSPFGAQYCLRVDVREKGGTWTRIEGCIKVMGDTLEVPKSDVTAINVSVCLTHRPDVCGLATSAEIHSSEKEPTLTEEHVIIIACVCAFIIVFLLIVLVCFICRRRRAAAKYAQESNAGDPPPYSAVQPNKKPQAYDNAGMEHESDVPFSEPPGGASGGVAVHANRLTNNSYGPLDLRVSSEAVPSSGKEVTSRPQGSAPHIDRHIFQNEINLRNENNRMEGYPGRDGPPRSPAKDKYLDLQDRGDGVTISDPGYNNSEPNKPKKVIYEVVV